MDFMNLIGGQAQTELLSISQYIAILRDVAFTAGLILLGWKSRSWFQPVLEFFKVANRFFRRADAHMDLMEQGMETLMGNHLHHIQADLHTLTSKDDDAI